jgi:hypothetical protein
MVIAARDGSFSGNLAIAEPLSVNPVFGSGPMVAIWAPDSQSLAGMANYSQDGWAIALRNLCPGSVAPAGHRWTDLGEGYLVIGGMCPGSRSTPSMSTARSFW